MKSDILSISKQTTVKFAIAAMDSHKVKAIIVVDDQHRYVGTVSIVELRRLMMSGANEDSRLEEFNLSRLSMAEHDLNRRERVAELLEDIMSDNVYPVAVLNAAGEVADVVPVDKLRTTIGGAADTKPSSRKETVLIIGGAGYLGTVLCRKLLERNFSVRILDSFIYGRKAVQSLTDHPDVTIIEGDIRNIETIIESLKDVDSVVLLAAVVGDPASFARPSETIQTNCLAAQAIASACELHHINRFVYASTCSVYGLGEKILDETAALNPVSLYARTKISSEQSIMHLLDDHFAPTILRMATLYGYSPRMRFDLVVNTMTMKAFLEQQIMVFGGSQWRPLLHVEDAADAYARVLEADIDHVRGKIYNVGSEEQNYQIIDLAKTVSKALGGVAIKTQESSIDGRDYRVSFQKIRTDLGFKPHHSVESAAKEIYTKLQSGEISDPTRRVFYNHFFDSSEEK